MLEKRFNGNQVVILSNNIMIIPDKPSKNGLFRDNDINYVFPHPVPQEKVREVYLILTE